MTFLRFIFILCVQCLPVRTLYVIMFVCAPCAYGDQKRMSDPLELELPMVVLRPKQAPKMAVPVTVSQTQGL